MKRPAHPLRAIADRPDVHGATARAMLSWLADCRPQIVAAIAEDAASSVPLLGGREHWLMPMLDPGDPTRLEPCRWRLTRDAHCLCHRCGSQPIELLLARAIAAPCEHVAACYWCRHAGDADHYAAGIVTAALGLARRAEAPADATRVIDLMAYRATRAPSGAP